VQRGLKDLSDRKVSPELSVRLARMESMARSDLRARLDPSVLLGRSVRSVQLEWRARTELMVQPVHKVPLALSVPSALLVPRVRMARTALSDRRVHRD